MWLCNSSIGRKFVMSITGLALILFLLFHMSMNLVAIFSPEGYNAICAFLGANWYAVVASIGLAGLMIIHIIYAFWLNVQNHRARGNDRYAVTARPHGVEWSSQNMLVLGIIVMLGIGFHLFNFWAKMQLAELMHTHDLGIAGVTGPTDGAGLIAYTFSNPIFSVLYLVWLLAIWFHINHGFWSALQTIGWNNVVWMKRIRVLSTWVSSILMLGFAAVVLHYFGRAICDGNLWFY